MPTLAEALGHDADGRLLILSADLVGSTHAATAAGITALREGVATTSVFVEDFFGGDARLEVLMRILATLEPGTTELMCHPARVDEVLRCESSYVVEREQELAVLTHPEAIRAVRENNILLTHFGEL